jgi:perosamine synthetase
MRIGIAAPNLGEKELEYVTDAVKSTWISSKGKYVKGFEDKFAEYIGTKYAYTVCNGTAALHLAMLACGVGPGDEVIMPATTMIACANVVKYCGGNPVFVDIEEDTWCIDPADIVNKITKNTVAIMPVHLYGHPADMSPILGLAEEYNLHVIEDAAEAHGAEYHGKKVGGLGDIGCFSFYGNKILATGEGGMVTTDDDDLAKKLDSLRNQAYDPDKRDKLIHSGIGYNYRLTNVQCALGLAQLERIDEFIKIHRDNADRYNRGLGKGLILPPEKSWAKNVYWMYTTVLDVESPTVRDMLMEKLKSVGVETRAVFPAIYHQPPYKDSSSWCTVADWFGDRGLNLPSGNSTTFEEVDYVAEKIREFLEVK